MKGILCNVTLNVKVCLTENGRREGEGGGGRFPRNSSRYVHFYVCGKFETLFVKTLVVIT